MARRMYARLDDEGRDGLGRVRVNVHGGSASWFSRITRGVSIGTGSEKALGPNGDLEVLETTVHEVTHKWMDSRAGFIGLVYGGPSGRLSEGLSQVMAGATLALEGETDRERAWGWHLLDPRNQTTPMRSEIPGRPTKWIPLSVTMDDVKRAGFTLTDQGYVHVHSGVIQEAHLQMAKAIGMEPMAKITTTAARDRLHPLMGFKGWAKATIATAARLHGEGSAEEAAVRQAWQAVKLVLPG
jgi:Zn-dependent metalloprotease